MPDFFTGEYWYLDGSAGIEGGKKKVPFPIDADFQGIFEGRLLALLRTDWVIEGALLEKRQRAYDDFIAVAQDLISKGYTSPEHLGIRGSSNGGLLVGAVTTQRADLFAAVICAVPLLDMIRYNKLSAGASWMAEYGNPDIPEERAYIEKYSPYQNVRADVDYPEIFFWTNTRDDRVHPGHARTMVAKLTAQNHPVLYFENTEGGHGGGANLLQQARTTTLELVYLLQKLKD